MDNVNDDKSAEHAAKSPGIPEKEEATSECRQNRLASEAYASLVCGNPMKAIAPFEEALTISQKRGEKQSECAIKSQLGVAYTRLHDEEKAIQYHEQALTLAKELERQDLQLEECISIGVNYVRLGEYQRAMEYFKMGLPLSDNLEAPFEALLALGNVLSQEGATSHEEALKNGSEKEKGLDDKGEVSTRDIPSEVYRCFSTVLIDDKQKMKALAIADKGRGKVLTDLMSFSYPGIKRTTGPLGNLLSLSEIQQMTKMSPASTILFISITSQKLYIWVLKPDGSITLRETTPESREALKTNYSSAMMREERDRPNLNQGQDEINPEKPESTNTPKQISSETLESDPSVTKQGTQKKTNAACRAMYDLLIAPVADLLDGANSTHPTEELVFVPDSPLCLVPFAAIQGPDGTYLSDTFRIRVIPSLSSLNHILSSPPDYHSNTGALIVGDPKVGYVQYNGTMTNIGRLPYAKTEAKIIGKILKVKPLTRYKATKKEVLRRMTSVSLVHLAVHGNSETGDIALSPNASTNSGIIKEKDYLLSAADVLSTKMRAKLVVLSCSGSGCKKPNDKGLVDIARAFLGAGARAVIASMCIIDDGATLYFMCHFYKNLVEGKSASASLQEAMRELRQTKNFKDARHWAPFVLIGDDVKVSVGIGNV